MSLYDNLGRGLLGWLSAGTWLYSFVAVLTLSQRRTCVHRHVRTFCMGVIVPTDSARPIEREQASIKINVSYFKSILVKVKTYTIDVPLEHSERDVRCMLNGTSSGYCSYRPGTRNMTELYA
jgi:hypothetical protein